MSDHSELNRMAEATKGWDNLKSCWPEETEDGDLGVNWFVGGVSDDDERCPVVEVNTAQYDAFEAAGHLARFYAAANPAAVLALIAEVEGLRAQHSRDSAELRSLCQARDDARKDRDQLKEEVEALRKLGPSKEIIWCACGDGYPVNSYGAGFMDANEGVCANCDAALGQGEQS